METHSIFTANDKRLYEKHVWKQACLSRTLDVILICVPLDRVGA